MTGRGMFRADEPVGQRWDFAVQLLQEGKRIVTNDIVIDCSDPSSTTIEICTSQMNHNAERSKARLQSAQTMLEAFREASPTFDQLLQDQEVRFVYVYDDDNTRTTLGSFTPDGHYHPHG